MADMPPKRADGADSAAAFAALVAAHGGVVHRKPPPLPEALNLLVRAVQHEVAILCRAETVPPVRRLGDGDLMAHARAAFAQGGLVMAEAGGKAAVLMEPAAIACLADRMAGGKGAPCAAPRQPTRIETGLARLFLTRTGQVAAESGIAPLAMLAGDALTDFAALAASGRLAGVALPLVDARGRSAAPVILCLVDAPGHAAASKNASPQSVRKPETLLRQRIGSAEIPVGMVLDGGRHPLAALQSLCPGHVLSLGEAGRLPVRLQAAGVAAHAGTLGHGGTGFHMKVTHRVTDEDGGSNG